MATRNLEIPLMVWLNATPLERDGFYLAAGFNPALPVEDAGTDTQFVRFQQDDIVGEPERMEPIPGAVDLLLRNAPQAGDDLRDFTPLSAQLPITGGITDEMGLPVAPLAIIGVASLLTRVPAPVRATFLGWVGTKVIGSRIAYQTLPFWLKQVMITLGLTGVTIVVDEALDAAGLPNLPGSILPRVGPGDAGLANIPIPGIQQAQVVGTWDANGVIFYRLIDGRIAVQNKKGRWKVWKPKRPIVLYASGSSDLKTLMRADKAVTKQVKKLASMINRRAPRRKSPSGASTPIILGNNARVVDV